MIAKALADRINFDELEILAATLATVAPGATLILRNALAHTMLNKLGSLGNELEDKLESPDFYKVTLPKQLQNLALGNLDTSNFRNTREFQLALVGILQALQGVSADPVHAAIRFEESSKRKQVTGVIPIQKIAGYDFFTE